MGGITEFTEEFQSLIGRLQTPDGTQCRVYMELFQFIIGRLQTTKFSKSSSSVPLFQFLIGRLQTRSFDYVYIIKYVFWQVIFVFFKKNFKIFPLFSHHNLKIVKTNR